MEIMSGSENPVYGVAVRALIKRLMPYLKVACWAGCIFIFVSNTLFMAHWNERRGVWDDLGYLRQAHLFQRFGLDGINTDARRDDDHFYVKALKDIGLEETGDYKKFVSHNFMAATNKLVLQSPPGVGFLLSLFPEGFQVAPLYFICSVVVFGFAIFLIGLAPTLLALAVCAMFGWVSIIFMINPAKASYSIAPTLAVCAVAGWLTALFFAARSPHRRLMYAAIVGLLLGLSVNFRIANLFLAGGYCFGFLIWFVASRRPGIVLEAALFGGTFVIGMIPTMVSNAVNAGSPFRTTYSAGDAIPPELNLDIVRYYLADVQSLAVGLLCTLIGWTFIYRRQFAPRAVACLCLLTIASNLAFFLTHDQLTQYYLVPFTMLAFWSLLFSLVITPLQADASTVPLEANAVASHG
jgi:hypothetical protein